MHDREGEVLKMVSKMQAIVHTAPPVQNLDLSVRETASSSSHEECSRSQSTGIPNDLPLTKLEMADKQTDSERKNSQGHEMKVHISCSPSNRSRFFKHFVKKRTKNPRQWKACEAALLTLVTVVTVSVNAVPLAISFTVEVSSYFTTIGYHTSTDYVSTRYIIMSCKF